MKTREAFDYQINTTVKAQKRKSHCQNSPSAVQSELYEAKIYFLRKKKNIYFYSSIKSHRSR